MGNYVFPETHDFAATQESRRSMPSSFSRAPTEVPSILGQRSQSARVTPQAAFARLCAGENHMPVDNKTARASAVHWRAHLCRLPDSSVQCMISQRAFIQVAHPFTPCGTAPQAIRLMRHCNS